MGWRQSGVAQLATLAALVRVYDRDGRATVRAVATECGRAVSTVHDHLRALRRAGLVGWEDEQQGTLRPTFTAHPVGQ